MNVWFRLRPPCSEFHRRPFDSGPNLMPVLAVLLLLLVLPVAVPGEQAIPDRYWPSKRLAGQLGQSVSVHWNDVPLRDAVERLSQSQRLCVWLDRRVDPTIEVSLSANDESLASVLDHLAARVDGAYVAIGDIVYVGPAKSARDARTVLELCRQETLRLNASRRRAMQRRLRLEISRLAQPRELVEQVSGSAGLQVEASIVPHDLRRALSIPAMPTSDILGLLLLEFDLTWQASDDGRSIEVVPIERPVTVRRRYDRKQLENVPSGTIATDAVIADPNGQQSWIDARVEVHDTIVGRRRDAPIQRPDSTRQVYSLRVKQQPIGPILEQLAKQLKLQLDMGDIDDTTRSQRVSFEVANADLDELLQAACESCGLTCEREGGVIRVIKADN